jgi:hypothetical protein
MDAPDEVELDVLAEDWKMGALIEYLCDIMAVR